MYCPKCGFKGSESDHFCSNCGFILSNNSDSSYDYNIPEDLEKYYTGNNYEKIKNKKFSIPMFFLGTYYLLYRKMWLYAFLYMIVATICNIGFLVYHRNYCFIILLGCSIVMSISFNKLYLKKVRKQVEIIRQKNSDKSNQELIKRCEKKGGVSVLAVIIYFLLIVIISIFTIIGFVVDTIKENITENQYIDKNNFNGLKYVVPNIFEKENDGNDSYRSFRYQKNKDACYINISNYKVYAGKNEEDYLKSIVFINIGDQTSEVLSKKINGYTWKYVEVQSNYKKNYYYVCIYSSRVYQIQYTISQDDNKLCSKGYTNFINSLIFQQINSSIDKI